MSTRGLYGIQSENIIYGQYNHFDSYPEGLGIKYIKTLNTLIKENKLSKLIEKIKSLKVVKKHDKPTEKEIRYYHSYGINFQPVSSKDDFYSLFYSCQEPAILYKLILDDVIKHWVDSKDFMNDFVFCEYAYIWNHDKKSFEIYESDFENNLKLIKSINLDNNKIKKNNIIFKNPILRHR